jgi:ABC-type uncharacterized transport system YnjBCD permease subunit
MLARPLGVAFAIGFAVSVGQYLPTPVRRRRADRDA